MCYLILNHCALLFSVDSFQRIYCFICALMKGEYKKHVMCREGVSVMVTYLLPDSTIV